MLIANMAVCLCCLGCKLKVFQAACVLVVHVEIATAATNGKW